MPPSGASAGDVFVGRSDELVELASTLDSVRAGHGRAVLVTGDAGVGKTRLVRRAAALADGFLVLAGTCMPLSALSVPLLPIRAALAGLPAARRPDLDGSGGRGAAEELDRWLEEACAQRPVALVVDDLQWADPATLDVLMWVIAGLAPRRLAVLATVRRGEAGPDHPLTRWTADVRRLPGFTQLSVGPLDLEETRDQVAGVLGDVPHDRLVREVFDRTGGNAYLNQLLVAGLPATATGLGGGALPEDLSAAVLRAWHVLSPQARELSRVIAVGGRVARGAALSDAAALAGVDEPGPLLRECVEAGVFDVQDGDGYWFHHPLQAEALEASLAAPERHHLHAAFAESLERELERDQVQGHGVQSVPGPRELETLSLIADHHNQAGHASEAYDWALRAADHAEAIGAADTQVRLLWRALEVGQLSDSTTQPRLELWERLRRAAGAVGDHENELTAVEALVTELDHEQDPLAVAELLVRRQHLLVSTGRSFLDPAEMARAVELARAQPGSWQHAFALAEHAHASLWQDDPAAPQRASLALELARSCGHPRALAHALAANTMLAVVEDRCHEGRRLGREAVDAAARARDGFAFVHAALWEANAFNGPISPEWRRLVGQRRAELTELGAPQPFVAWLATNEAGGHLHAGDVDACAQLLRLALGSTPGALVDVQVRLSAAWLAAIQGRPREAEGHLARADELFAETSTFLAFEFDAVRALVLLSAGHLRAAYEAALAGTATPGVPPTMCEWLLPLAGRALADLAQRERDSGGTPTPLLTELDALTARFPRVIADIGGRSGLYVRQLAGLQAMYEAEVARGRHQADAYERWAAAASALHGILPWEECYALWREAESLLLAGPAHRGAGADALRRSSALARGLGAQPIIDELETLARGARLPLATPVTSEALSVATAKGSLTTRESEILAHVVAGRTYGEIARALVISEKTVSSHISHLLAKTGTRNRIDLARWATRSSS